jgi:hypothetical protein
MIKSRLRDEKGELDPSKIEREVQKFIICTQKVRLKSYSHLIEPLLLSEAIRLAEYFEAEERRDHYNVRTIGKTALKRGFLGEDVTTYAIEISPKL